MMFVAACVPGLDLLFRGPMPYSFFVYTLILLEYVLRIDAWVVNFESCVSVFTLFSHLMNN